MQTSAQYAGAIIFSVCFGWLRHAFARLRQDVAIANNLSIAAAGSAKDKLSDSEIGGSSYLGLGSSATVSSGGSDSSSRAVPSAVSQQHDERQHHHQSCSECPGNPANRYRRLTRFQSWLVCGFLRRNYWALRLLDALIFGCVSTIGFLNMLVVMAFNPGLMMAIVGGEMLGVLTVEPLAGLQAGEPLSVSEIRGTGCH